MSGPIHTPTFAQMMLLERSPEHDKGSYEHYVAPALRAEGTTGAYDRMFGGHLLAICLTAAQRSSDAARSVHSLHAYFLRPGDETQPMDVRVEIVRDGRSFSARSVSVFQLEKEVFRVTLSLQVPTTGLVYDGPPLPPLPAPDDVTITYDDYREDRDTSDDADRMQLWDLRYIDPPKPNAVTTKNQRMWVRMRGPLDDHVATHCAALAYLSDSTLIDHVLLPHGLSWSDPNFDGASLDHAMWFHRHSDATQWHLFDQSVLVHRRRTGTGRWQVLLRVRRARCDLCTGRSDALSRAPIGNHS